MRRTSEKPLEWTPDEASPSSTSPSTTSSVGSSWPRSAAPDGEAGEVVVAVAVHARHLRRLAADQRAAGQPAALGDAGDDRRALVGIELAGREIVEEEQRLGALHDDVVDAHGDEVDADRVVPARLRWRS